MSDVYQREDGSYTDNARGAGIRGKKINAVERLKHLQEQLDDVNEEWNIAVHKVFNYRRLARSRHGNIKALAKLVNEAYYVEEFYANGDKKKFNETIVNQQMQTILNTKGYL